MPFIFVNNKTKTPSWKKHWKNESEIVFRAFLFVLICILAFCIRLFSVLRFESIIHEFDPWFNFRTTKLLVKDGFYAFHNWFDSMTWYPLGRNIGGTTYPGLMWTAAILYKIVNFLNIPIDIRNICVFLAPFMSALTCIVTFFLTLESWDSQAGIISAFLVSIVPGYISRSVAGSYDNEAVAIFALINVFYFWVKSVKTGSLFWSCICALSYFYMVASWGGYIFVINLIPFHVFTLLIMGRFSYRLYIAYTTFYTIGTLLSMQIQFVHFLPILTLEHFPALGIFGLLQFWTAAHIIYTSTSKKYHKTLNAIVYSFIFFGLVVFISLVYFDVIPSITGRLLTLLGFTENLTIVKSVSEHQSTSWSTFFFDMHFLVILLPAGIILCILNLTDANIFIILYAIFSSYFSGIMIRLVLVISPVACVFGGIVISEILRSSFDVLTRLKNTSRDQVKFSCLRALTALFAIFSTFFIMNLYQMHSTWASSAAYSSPSLILSGQRSDGSQIIFDDFREAYSWLSHNTESDAKIMSWWDYGYQITGLGNRTVLVDNNTRNNTHIATVGMCMSSSEETAYPYMLDHHVDYVLVVFGGRLGYSSDDINKFLWMIRISSGVYPHVVESKFFDSMGRYSIGDSASKTMRESLMYKMCYYRFNEIMTQYDQRLGYDRVRGQSVPEEKIVLTHLEEAYTTENWVVRIYRVKRPEELSRF